MTTNPRSSQSKNSNPNSHQNAIPKAAKDSLEQQSSTELTLPIIGKISLPPIEDLAWYGGIALLGASGIVDWPILGIVIAGKILSEVKGNKTISTFGSSLEQAS